MPDTARDFAEFALMGHDLQSSKAQCLEPRYYATTQSGNRIHSNVVFDESGSERYFVVWKC